MNRHEQRGGRVPCLVRRALRHVSGAQTPSIPVFVSHSGPHLRPPDR